MALQTYIGKKKEMYELIFSWLPWVVVLFMGSIHDSGSVVQDGGHAPNNRLTETIDICQNKVFADQYHVIISQAQL